MVVWSVGELSGVVRMAKHLSLVAAAADAQVLGRQGEAPYTDQLGETHLATSVQKQHVWFSRSLLDVLSR